MMNRPVHGLTACVLTAVLLAGSAAFSQTPQVQFTEGSPSTVTLPPGKTATVTLGIQSMHRNGTLLGDPRLYFVGTPALQAHPSLERRRLAPGEVATLTIVFTHPGGPPIRTTGYLAVPTNSGVLTRTIQIAPPAPTVSAATLPLDKWTTTATVGCPPGIPGCRQLSLPFPVDTAATGELLRKAGDSSYDGKATVRPVVKGKAAQSDGLTLSGLDGPGIYHGAFRAGGAALDLTVHVRHWVGWLVLALATGVFTALWLSHYTSVRRTLWSFRARYGALVRRLGRLQPYQGMVPDVTAVRRSLDAALASVEALATSAFRDLEQQPGFTTALAELALASASMAAWADLPKKVDDARSALDEAHRAFGDQAPRPPMPDGRRLTVPMIVEWADALVARRQVPLEDAPKLASSLEEVPAALELVSSLNDTAAAALEWIRTLRSNGVPEAQLQPVSIALHSAWWEVWKSRDPATLLANQTEHDLDTVQTTLAGFGNPAINDDELAASATFTEKRAGIDDAVIGMDEVGRAPGTDGDGGRRYDPGVLLRRIAAWDWAFLLLALVLAILTGLKELYFDKDFFGTVADYLGAILWGFGVKTVLDVTVAAAGKLFGGRLPAAVAPAPSPPPVPSALV